MTQLPVPPGSVWGANPSSQQDAAGALFYSAFASGLQRVYKMEAAGPRELQLDHACTARGLLQIGLFDGCLYLTGWDDKAAGLWRMKVPEFVSFFTLAAQQQQIGALQIQKQQIVEWIQAMQEQIGAIEIGALSEDDRASLDWAAKVRALP
jgi:hypothetical protein